MAADMHSLYLFAGSDEAKIDATRARLRARAEGDGGPGALQVFEPSEGRGGPDHEALVAAIPAMSLTASRRYLLADGVERWGERQIEQVAGALSALPPDLTVVLVAHGKPAAKLVTAVRDAGGEVREFAAAGAREMPRRLVAEAKGLGFVLEPAAAQMLVDRMGASSLRLHNELERLSVWAGEGGTVTPEDLDAMVADTSEAVIWALSDALLERDPARALDIAEQLISQGENVTGLIYGLASRLRKACSAAVQLEEGVPPKQVESSLSMHPYAARKLLARIREVSLDDLREATIVLAELEVWCRGGADYGDELALTVALRRAAGAADPGQRRL